MIRISLGFSENDDDQFQAAAILKGLGRKKASYLTNLILADAQGNVEAKVKDSSLSEDKIKELIKQELASYFSQVFQGTQPSLNANQSAQKTAEKDFDADVDSMLDNLQNF